MTQKKKSVILNHAFFALDTKYVFFISYIKKIDVKFRLQFYFFAICNQKLIEKNIDFIKMEIEGGLI